MKGKPRRLHEGPRGGIYYMIRKRGKFRKVYPGGRSVRVKPR